MGRTLMLATVAVIALLIVGSALFSAIGALLRFALYIALGVLLVGGVLTVLGKARGALRGGRRELP